MVFEGQPAVLFGVFVAYFGVYTLYYLFFKAEASELKLTDFHELDDFEDIIDGYKTRFEVENTAAIVGQSPHPVVFYRLEIRFRNKLNLGLDIKRRDRIEHLLWTVWITRFFGVHTSHHNFDSQYRVKCSNEVLFRSIFDNEVLTMLEQFDRNYPPIRKKNGVLRITDTFFRYVEGPYAEESRIFDPHRGKIEDLFRELIRIMERVEQNNLTLRE